MGNHTDTQQRLHRVVDVARVYRGWSRAEMAQALRRDPSNVYPDTDNPRIDFFIRLAEVLEWPVDAVVDYYWKGVTPVPEETSTEDFEQLDQQAFRQLLDGDPKASLDVAMKMQACARTAEDRARAYRREASAWDAIGRYGRAMEATKKALNEAPLPTDLRQALQSNLAIESYTIGDVVPAEGMARSLIEWFIEQPPVSLREKVTQAFAYYVYGNCHRHMISRQETFAPSHADRAVSHLGHARELFQQLAESNDLDDLAAVANTCSGAILEAEAALGRRPPDEAIELLCEGLPAEFSPEGRGQGEWIESIGWWCIFGGNVALRHLEGDQLDHYVAIFSNKLLEVAERLENWAFRDYVVMLQLGLHQRTGQQPGFLGDLLMDSEDIRLLVGIMGRFPVRRGLGWRILEDCKVVGDVDTK